MDWVVKKIIDIDETTTYDPPASSNRSDLKLMLIGHTNVG